MTKLKPIYLSKSIFPDIALVVVLLFNCCSCNRQSPSALEKSEPVAPHVDVSTATAFEHELPLGAARVSRIGRQSDDGRKSRAGAQALL